MLVTEHAGPLRDLVFELADRFAAPSGGIERPMGPSVRTPSRHLGETLAAERRLPVQEARDDSIAREVEIFRDRLRGARVKVIPRVGFDVNASCGMFT